MKKLKDITKRIATLGLAAALMVNSFPATAFAAEIGDPDLAAVSDGDTKEEKDAEEKKLTAFKESKSIDGVRITVEAEEGVFPEGAVLSVEKVTKEQEKKAEEAVETERSENQNVAVSYIYDIKVLDKGGNELQPADENGEDSSSRVKVSFKLDEVADENLTTNVYHITENGNETTESNDVSTKSDSDKEETEGAGSKSAEAASLNDTDSTVDGESASRESTDGRETTGGIELVAEKLPVETDGDTATAETDGFSLYTVEFTYDNKQYVLTGDSEVALSEVLDTVGLTGEVSAVGVSNESLFSAKKCRTAKDGSTPEKDEDGKVIEDENGAWFVFAHQAFSTEEWMKVTIGGVVYEIIVTDDTTEVTAWDGLKTALSAGGEVKLTKDITAEETDTHLLVPKNTAATLDLNGHRIDYSASNEDLTGAEDVYKIIHYGAIVVLGTLTIKDSGTDGTITGGTDENAKASLAAYGNVTMQGGTLIGGVYLGDEENKGYGGITMTGGTIDGQMFIDNNSSFSMQEGCKVENTIITCNGTFTMTGGSISGNNVSKVVFVGGTFTMSGGMISGTEVEDCVVEANRIFTMTGGEVSGTGKIGGIFSLNPLSFHISGAPKISSVYLYSDSLNNALVNIDGPLTSDASIPVISSQKPTADTPVVITFGLANGGENAESYFYNETAGTSMVKNSDGELELQREATEWDALQTLLSQDGTVTLTQNYTATSVDQKLTIPKSTQVTIDLNGHKIDGSKLTTGFVFYIDGASVNTPYSTLTITDSGNGGEILCGNNGAVELGGGYLTFNMQGGTITSSGCQIIRTGSAGSFNMSGGTINGEITDSDTPVPGSVVNMGVDGFHMTGGTISGTGYENVVFFNTVGALPSYISGGVISGTNVTNVVNLENGSFTARGGTIDGDNATNAVCVSRWFDNLSTLRFAVSGSPTIKGPVVLTCDEGSLPVVTVAGALEKDISISSDKGAVVAEADTEYTLTESDVSHIKSAVSGLDPVFGDNVVRLKKPFTSEDITIGSIQAKTYTGTPYSPAITVKDGDTVLVENTDYTISLPEGHTDAGDYTATIIGKGNDYTGEKTASFTIDKAPLTVTAKDHSITYGDAPSGGGVTCSGLVNGEKESALGGELDYDFDYSQYGNAGSYTITPKGLTSGNYDISFQPGTLTVGKKDIRVSGITAKDKVYDGKPDAELDYTNAVLGGVVNNEELTVNASGTFADVNAGENKTVNISNLALGGSAVGNYKLAESGQQMTARATISKAEIPMEKITAPAVKTGLSYNGIAQELVTAGFVTGGIGTMKYYSARVDDTDNPPAAPTDEALYTTTIPTATNAGTYYVWYMVKGDRNHNDSSSNGPVAVTIEKASGGTINADAVEVQKGNNITASVNIRGYVGTGAVITGTSQVTPENVSGIRIENIGVSNDNLTFKVSSVNGGNVIITVTLTSDNYDSVTLTIPVKVQDRVTEVKLEPASGVESSVQSVTVVGLDDYTDSQSGESVKVVLKVNPVSAPQDSTVKTKIDNSVKVIFNGVEEGNIKTEYLDISIQKQVGTGNPASVGDVERVLELAITYDLTGKFHPVVIREHEGTVAAFTVLNAQPSEGNYQDGTFYVDEDQGIIYIYSRYFSTYSIAYTTVNYAKITTYPVAVENSVYDGTEHALIKAGTATGGEMQYAVGVSDKSAPTTGWSTSIPTATDAGTYYVWYKAVGDGSHLDSAPDFVSVTIGESRPAEGSSSVRSSEDSSSVRSSEDSSSARPSEGSSSDRSGSDTGKSSSSSDRDDSSSSGKGSASSSAAEGSGSHPDKGSASSSAAGGSGSQPNKDSGSSSDIPASTGFASPITVIKGTGMIVGDKAYVELSGADASKIFVKGKAGKYTPPASGEMYGIFEATGKGTARLYQQDGKKKVLVCAIRVEQPKLKPALKLKSGKSKKLKLSGTKTKADKWECSDNEVAQVTPDGVVSAKAAGTAKITAWIGTHSYVCELSVK